MTTALTWTAVALCGAVGSLARYTAGERIAALRPGDFPWGTFAINLSGGFVLGLLVGLDITHDALVVAGTGLLGSYTTFSTWMVEAQRLGEDGEWALMWLYLLGTMVAGLLSTGAGWVLGSWLA